MIDKKTFKFFTFFGSAYPTATVLMVVLLGIAGLFEGVGVATLIPLLSLAEGSRQPQNGLAETVVGVIRGAGLEPTLPVLVGIMFLSVLLKSAFMWFAMVQVSRTLVRVVRDLRVRLAEALMRARWEFFGSEQGGAWANAIGHEAQAGGAAYGEACQILAAAFPVAAYVIVAAALSWQVSLLALLSGGLVYFLLRYFIQWSRVEATAAAAGSRAMTGLTADLLQGLKPIKAMAREDRLLPILEQRVREVEGASLRFLLARHGLGFFHEPIVALMLGGAIFFVFTFSNLALSSIVVLAFTFYRILTHLNTVQMRYQTMMQGEATFWSLMDRLSAAERMRERLETGKPVPKLSTQLEFESVYFAYEDEPVIRDLDFVLRQGEFVAISGESGAGKTTFIDLATGLLTPTRGRILVDGTDLAKSSLRSWRSQIGYVPQEMLMLNDSIRMNVTLGDSSISDAEIEKALRLAGAWEFVSRTRSGLDTEMGDRGAKLSGGQRQRIALARALAVRPALLILDEVTTALDPATEAEICETLRSLAGIVTILAISHQPAIWETAHRTLVMSGGRLKETAQV